MGRRDQERCVGGRSLVELTGDPRCSRRYRSVVIFMCSLSHPCRGLGGRPFSSSNLPAAAQPAERRWAIQGGMGPPNTLVALGEEPSQVVRHCASRGR